MDIQPKEWLFFALSIVVTVVFTLLGVRWSRSKGLSVGFHCASAAVIGEANTQAIPGLAITYRDQQVPRLCWAMVTLWNSGDVAITKSALVATDPIRIAIVGEGRILDIRVVDPNPACELVTSVDSPDGQAVNVSFDFLNKGDGVRIRVLHTALDPNLRIFGSIIGGQIGTPRELEVNGIRTISRTNRIGWNAFLFFIIAFFAYISRPNAALPVALQKPDWLEDFSRPGTFILLLAAFLLGYVVVGYLKTLSGSAIPRKLRRK